MEFFKNHRISKFFTLLHFSMYLYVLYFFNSDFHTPPNSCGMANTTLVILSGFITCLGLLILIIKLFTSKAEKEFYFKVIILFMLTPFLVFLINLFLS